MGDRQGKEEREGIEEKEAEKGPIEKGKESRGRAGSRIIPMTPGRC